MEYDFLADHRILSESSSTDVSVQALQAKVESMESEMQDLRKNLAKAKGLNDAMWQMVIDKVLVPTDSEKQAKRSRMDTDES